MSHDTAWRLHELKAEWRIARTMMWDAKEDGDIADSQRFAHRADQIMLEIKAIAPNAVVAS